MSAEQKKNIVLSSLVAVVAASVSFIAGFSDIYERISFTNKSVKNDSTYSQVIDTAQLAQIYQSRIDSMLEENPGFLYLGCPSLDYYDFDCYNENLIRFGDILANGCSKIDKSKLEPVYTYFRRYISFIENPRFKEKTPRKKSKEETAAGWTLINFFKIFFTIAFCGAGLFIVLSGDKYSEETVKWAFGILTLISGIWIGSLT